MSKGDPEKQILPHELELLGSVRQEIKSAKEDLAREQYEAVGPSMDWHDNPAYDEVLRQRDRLDDFSLAVSGLLREHVVVEYPTPETSKVMLGSLVQARDQYGTAFFALVGQRVTGPSFYEKKWESESEEDFFVVTPDSPVGAALLNTSVGDEISYTQNNGSKNTLLIEGVDQNWVKEKFNTA